MRVKPMTNNEEARGLPVGPEDGMSEERNKQRIDWDDPSIPVGDAPPMPSWPVVTFAIAWGGWVVFLIVMMLSAGPAQTP